MRRKFRKQTTLRSKSSALKGLLYAPIQRKQYFKRTTLRRLKIPLRSICSKEGLHYRLGAKRKESCHLTSDNQPLFTSWISFGDSTLGLYCIAWLTQESVSSRIFCEKERYESCSVQWTFTANAFRTVRKGENLPVVKLLPGSHERLAFEKPMRSVPETWGRMYDVPALRN